MCGGASWLMVDLMGREVVGVRYVWHSERGRGFCSFLGLGRLSVGGGSVSEFVGVCWV